MCVLYIRILIRMLKMQWHISRSYKLFYEYSAVKLLQICSTHNFIEILYVIIAL